MKEKTVWRILCLLLLGAVLLQQGRISRQEGRLEALDQALSGLEVPAPVQAVSAPGEDAPALEQQLLTTAALASEANVIVTVYETTTVHRYEDTFDEVAGTEVPADQIAGQGSGVLLGEDLVLTCCHIAADRSRIGVRTQEGEELTGELLKTDPLNDLALVRVPGIGGEVLPLGEGLSLGQPVVCAGNPASLHLAGTVTFGIVSGLHREMGSLNVEGETVNVFQTDAPINGGSSGGGVYDLRGRLQGIVTRKYIGTQASQVQLEAIGMCVPIEGIRAFLETP